ncbi:hypothetical protein HKX48_004066 [Thoreauomyces humboldtii]|nr:hypothetical protein HKX48_004066 [Thoreauomyces humboldtii]
MEEDELALVKAIESGDTDLVHLVIMHLKRKLSPAEFFRMVGPKPLARSLLESYCKQQEPQLLRDFYYQDDRNLDSANGVVLEGYRSENATERMNKFKIAAKMYSDDKDRSFEAKATDDAIKLLQMQESLTRELGQDYLGLSVSETIAKLLELGHASKASKVKSDMKVPDKRFWWLKTRSLVHSQDWEGLEKFAKSNSKLGYAGIVDMLVRVKTTSATAQAQKYVEFMRKAGGAQEREAQQFADVLPKLTPLRASGSSRSLAG